jgi:hypothetical protein
MTIKSILELLAQADATIEDNTTGNITPSDVRAMFKDFLDTMSPAYGVLRATNPVAFNVPASPPAAFKPFAEIVASTAGFFNCSAANGVVTRLIASAGIAGASSIVLISGEVAGTNNDNVNLEVFKNGVATGWRTSAVCQGTGEFVGFNIAGFVFDTGADVDYELRVSGTAGSKDFRNMVMLFQAQPVRSFT